MHGISYNAILVMPVLALHLNLTKLVSGIAGRGRLVCAHSGLVEHKCKLAGLFFVSRRALN